MKKYHLEFEIDPATTGPYGYRTIHDESYKLWHATLDPIIKAIGIRDYPTFYHIDIPSPEFEAILNQVESWAQQRVAHFGFGRLTSHTPLDWPPVPTQDWTRFEPSEYIFRDEKSKPFRIQCDASRMMPERHIRGANNPFIRYEGYELASMPNYICVSEQFIRIIQENSLKGLEFIYVEDTCICSASQWYIAIPLNALGRGMDHPWIDPEKYFQKKKINSEKYPPEILNCSIELQFALGTLYNPIYRAASQGQIRHGINSFDHSCLNTNAALNDLIMQRLLSLYDRDFRNAFGWEARCVDLLIQEDVRVLVDYLPTADFAYYGDDSALYMSPRATRVLYENAIFCYEDFYSENMNRVHVLSSPPPGCGMLDQLGPTPLPPQFEPGLLKKLADDGKAAWAKYAKTRKKTYSPNLDHALKLLDQFRERNPRDVGASASHEEILAAETELGRPLPLAWRRVLQFSKSICLFESEFETLEINRYATYTPEFLEDVEHSSGHRPPASWIVIGTACNGDTWVIDPNLSFGDGSDCRFIRFSHETLHPHREWLTVAEFLEWAVNLELEREDEE